MKGLLCLLSLKQHSRLNDFRYVSFNTIWCWWFLMQTCAYTVISSWWLCSNNVNNLKDLKCVENIVVRSLLFIWLIKDCRNASFYYNYEIVQPKNNAYLWHRNLWKMSEKYIKTFCNKTIKSINNSDGGGFSFEVCSKTIIYVRTILNQKLFSYQTFALWHILLC